MKFLGLGKTLFNSSVTLVKSDQGDLDVEIVITERLDRKKYSGAWPEKPLKYIFQDHQDFSFIIENSDVVKPIQKEEILNKSFPFYEKLKSEGLDQFCSALNKNVKFIPHHLAHAYAALAFRPFNKGHLLVLDGGGSRKENTQDNEFLSLYKFNQTELELVTKLTQSYRPATSVKKNFSNGVGAFYESISEFIFGDKFSAGKVMGLASFGKGEVIKPEKYYEFLNSLDWKSSFVKGSKKDWELSPNMELYKKLAATAQASLEDYLFDFLGQYPDIKSLIFTGGCALNCTFNWKLINQKGLDKLFIPPNPNDSGISLGCAMKEAISSLKTPLKHSFLGPKSSNPYEHSIPEIFSSYSVSKPNDLNKKVTQYLKEGEVIAWFQGRSEVGPRALGHRSLIAGIDRKDLKNYLNEHIKFRETFRPYACSVLEEDSSKLFTCEEGFLNPFMSFAVPVREEHRDFLKEVTHVDGTNRMQIVSKETNEAYYSLLQEVKKSYGYGIVLNTSLNIMGQPILETPHDLLEFLKDSVVKIAVIGDFLIEK